MTATLIRPARPAPDDKPWFPWRPHAHNPRPTPLAPDPAIDRGRPPVPWSTQCRECWGFVDDPRHLTSIPNEPLERG